MLITELQIKLFHSALLVLATWRHFPSCTLSYYTMTTLSV